MTATSPLRCLHVASGDLWAGAEVSAFHLMRELHEREGVEVEAALLNPGELHDRLDEAGVTTHLIDESRHGFRALARELRRVAAERGASLLHSHRYKEHVLAALAARRLDLFHVRSAHGRPSRGLGPWADKVAAAWTGASWIAVSEDLAGELEGPRHDVTVIPNGLPEAPPQPDRAALDALGGEPGCRWLGFVGRFEQVKRPDRFVDLLAALPERIDGRAVFGAMLGDGTLLGATRSKIEAAGLAGRVLLAGHRRDAGRLLAALDLLVIPSDHEGDPMVLLEAMRARVPVAGSAVGSLALLGEPRWLAPAGDDAALADAARTLLASEDERRAWGERLHRRFLERGTIAVSADRVLALYRKGVG